MWCVCVWAGRAVTPTLSCIQKIQKIVIFLKQHPSFFPMLIKERGISTKPQHFTCLSVLPLTCFCLFSLLCFVVYKPLFLARALVDQPYIYLPFLCFAYISTSACSLSFSPLCHSVFHSVSRWTSPVWKNPGQWLNGKIAMATDTHTALPFLF